MRRALTAAAAAAVLLAGCGGGQSDEEAMVQTIRTSILRDQTFAGYEVSGEEATCVAEQVVGEIPARRLIAIGVRGDRAGGAELRPAEVDVFASAYTDCIDVRDILIQGIASAGTASEQVLACLDENIADEDIETIFRAGLAGEDAGATARRLLAPAVDTCTGRV